MYSCTFFNRAKSVLLSTNNFRLAYCRTRYIHVCKQNPSCLALPKHVRHSQLGVKKTSWVGRATLPACFQRVELLPALGVSCLVSAPNGEKREVRIPNKRMSRLSGKREDSSSPGETRGGRGRWVTGVSWNLGWILTGRQGDNYIEFILWSFRWLLPEMKIQPRARQSDCELLLRVTNRSGCQVLRVAHDCS